MSKPHEGVECPNETMVDGGPEYLRYGWKTTRPHVIEHIEEKDGPWPVLKKRPPTWPH